MLDKTLTVLNWFGRVWDDEEGASTGNSGLLGLVDDLLDDGSSSKDGVGWSMVEIRTVESLVEFEDRGGAEGLCKTEEVRTGARCSAKQEELSASLLNCISPISAVLSNQIETYRIGRVLLLVKSFGTSSLILLFASSIWSLISASDGFTKSAALVGGEEQREDEQEGMSAWKLA